MNSVLTKQEDKKIENAIKLANLLKHEYLRAKIEETKMIIAGNFSELNYEYIRFLEKMILDYGLQNYVKLLLPQPEGPINAITVFCLTFKLMFFSACLVPNHASRLLSLVWYQW
jgi:hypothetical protein